MSKKSFTPATPSDAAEESGDTGDVGRRRYADQAYDALESMIATLRLKPGAPIVEAQLIELTGLGRTPTREALMRLVSCGLITQQPRRGLQVSEIRLAEHLDLIEARRALERLIAATAARRAAPHQRKDLLACAEAMTAAAARGELHGYMSADQALDRVIHAACRNPAAIAAVIPMAIQCRRFWYAYQHQGDMALGAQLHLTLAQAIAQGEPDVATLACEALMDYLRGFAQAVIA